MDVDEVFAAPLRSALFELPIDNIFQILKFADPTDIFAFGQTCAKFLEITMTRTVWLNSLRRVCEVNSLFVPSFPYDEMLLSELQRAATFGAAPRRAVSHYHHGHPRSSMGSWLQCNEIKPHAVASIALLDTKSEPAISILPTEDGAGLEVMVMTTSSASETKKVTIANYHVFPLDTNPEFIPIFAYQDMIVGVGTKTIALWDMSTPHCDTREASRLENHLPLLTLSHPFPSRPEFEVTSSFDWFCATSTKPCFFTLTGWKGNSKRYTVRYTMHSLDRRANRNIPGSIPVLMDQSPVPAAWDYLDYCTEIQPCGGDALTVWTSQGPPQLPPVIEAHISPMPTEKRSEGPPFTTVHLFETVGERPEDFDFSICPIAGRLCTMTADVKEIMVLDFLIPSWEDEH
ncbi:hypothetical protein B0H14DRAFT_3569320 [Mycena olivaceomarginata]|nr:hypothetical protein B0H14DRAFT_3569320 [Mycena olivaceomarginata]